jgi:hypothetical protein
MALPPPQNLDYAPSPTVFDRIFRNSQGQIVIAQPPNLPVLVAVAATILQALLPSGTLQTLVDWIGFGAWFTWAWQELFEGVNYFRRGLGLVALIGLLGLRLTLG